MPNQTVFKATGRDHLAQWAFDTRPVLGRFHLWLESVETEWTKGEPNRENPTDMSFIKGQLERQLATTAAVTALGTKLYGRFGEGEGKSKSELNEIKKEADAVSAYSMSEGLWYLTRHLPENHALMICLGEGLMPKAGETPEMGANPQLGFGRVYARPEIAKKMDRYVQRLLNDPSFGWERFYKKLKTEGIVLWGAAVDTLENTSRFALGREEGTMTILHIYDQPLKVVRPYEGYMGTLIVPVAAVRNAEENSRLLDYRTPRAEVLESLLATYPDLEPERVHIWTLGGPSRAGRIGQLWEEWTDLGCHLVEDGWRLPNGHELFVESGTYSPIHAVGDWFDDQGHRHLFIVDGYAASAEAFQAATLAPLGDLEATLAVFTSTFHFDYKIERKLMLLDPNSPDYREQVSALIGRSATEAEARELAFQVREASEAGIPLKRGILKAEDLFPEKDWNVLAIGSYMGMDPYTGLPGVEKISESTYRVTVRLTSRTTDKRIHLTFRLMKGLEGSRTVFQPLLQRFLSGVDHTERAVKVSDSGRIRNELQTLCSEALEFPGGDKVRVHFDKIPPAVISPPKVKRLREVLTWYKSRHPFWFCWLEL